MNDSAYRHHAVPGELGSDQGGHSVQLCPQYNSLKSRLQVHMLQVIAPFR